MTGLRQLFYLFFLSLGLTGCGSTDSNNADWIFFKRQYLQPDGRVLDASNGGISHTEGQGIAMLLAVRNDDKASFDSMWQWTRTTLQVRDDKLFAWRWSPVDGVSDKNNATDGDLFIAWSLLRAYKRWNQQEYLTASLDIARAIRTKTTRTSNRGLMLLPGVDGFEKPEGTTINLSYWIFPAFAELAQVDPAPEWDALRSSGLALLTEGRFGKWGLPVDWTLLGETLTPATEPHFGYNAIRIPLYVVWAKLDTGQNMSAFQNYWTSFKSASYLPAWINVLDNSVASYSASWGMDAILRLTFAGPNYSSLQLPALDNTQGYYSSALLLLTQLAISERMP